MEAKRPDSPKLRYVSLRYKLYDDGSAILTGLMFGDNFFGHYETEGENLKDVTVQLDDDDYPVKVVFEELM